MKPFTILADDSSASAEGRFKADQQFLLKAASPGACSGFTHFYYEDGEDGLDENFAKDNDYDDGDYDYVDDGDDGDYEDATLQQRASRGPAPIQVIITRRPCPKVSYVSLLKDNNSQPQESKV